MTTWISVPRQSFRFVQGQPSYFHSSEGVRRGFCPACGTPLSYENAKLPDEIHLYAVALADPSAVTASAHVFAAEQLPWFESADALPRYAATRRGAQPLHHGPRKKT